MTISQPTTVASLLQQNAAAAAAATGTSSTAAGTSAQNLSDTFLKLLVAQMNNQDPLNPVDNSQVTSQMAQISTVTGISGLNTTMSQLVTQLQQSQAVSATQLTGHTVLVPGSSMALTSTPSSTGGTPTLAAYGGFSLAQAADTVNVAIKDSSGATVRTLSLGGLGSGVQEFSWDGTTDSGAQAAAGSYSYTVSASASGTAVSTTAYSAQQVVGVAPQSDGSIQYLLGNGSQVGFSSIAQIL